MHTAALARHGRHRCHRACHCSCMAQLSSLWGGVHAVLNKKREEKNTGTHRARRCTAVVVVHATVLAGAAAFVIVDLSCTLLHSWAECTPLALHVKQEMRKKKHRDAPCMPLLSHGTAIVVVVIVVAHATALAGHSRRPLLPSSLSWLHSHGVHVVEHATALAWHGCRHRQRHARARGCSCRHSRRRRRAQCTPVHTAAVACVAVVVHAAQPSLLSYTSRSALAWHGRFGSKFGCLRTPNRTHFSVQ